MYSFSNLNKLFFIILSIIGLSNQQHDAIIDTRAVLETSSNQLIVTFFLFLISILISFNLDELILIEFSNKK